MRAGFVWEVIPRWPASRGQTYDHQQMSPGQTSDGHGPRHAENLDLSAVTKKLWLVFFVHAPLAARRLSLAASLMGKACVSDFSFSGAYL